MSVVVVSGNPRVGSRTSVVESELAESVAIAARYADVAVDLA
jgi:hypothetical protein